MFLSARFKPMVLLILANLNDIVQGLKELEI